MGGTTTMLDRFWKRLFPKRTRCQSRQVERRRPWWSPLLVEGLESRIAPATFNWDGGGDGTTWTDARNWDSPGNNLLPGAADDAVINAAAGISIVHSSGTDSLRSLTSQNAILLSGGSLTIGAASTINNTFTLTGGTLSGTGDLTVSGLLSWTGGALTGGGRTVAQGGLALSGSNRKELGARTL